MENQVQDHPMTAAECAAMNFEPWSPEDLEVCKPPSNSEWNRMTHPHLVTLRIAWLTLAKTKPELVEMMRKLGENDEAGCAMMDGFIAAIDFFKQVLMMLEKAEARIICAGSVIEVDDGEDGEEPATSGEA
jgi:hypothetical protein